MPGFDAVLSATLTALVGAFVGAILSRLFAGVLPIIKAGEFSDAESAQQIIGYLSAIESNFVLIALLSAVITLLARAVVRGRPAT